MVLHKHGARLYNGVKQVIKEHLTSEIHSKLMPAKDMELLQTLHLVWSDHIICMKMIRDVLMYMVCEETWAWWQACCSCI